jgi:DNA-binding CsgD family transcriptional regulator
MAPLTSTHLLRLTGALEELYALGPVERFPARVLAATDRVIGCESASYNEIDIATGNHRVLAEPHELATADSIEVFGAHLHEHPVIAHYATTGDARSHMVSDFLRPRELRRLGLYANLFAPLGIEDQLSTTMPTMPATHVIGVALNRGKQGFSEHDRALLDLLRPHVLTAHSNALRYSAALEAAASDTGRTAAAAAALDRLTDRQREVLALVSDGRTNQQIAHELGISIGTARKHIEHILDRLDVHTRVAAASRYLAATHRDLPGERAYTSPGPGPTRSQIDTRAGPTPVLPGS